MYEVAALAVHTTTVFFEILALLRFVFVVQLVVFEQLVRSMGEFAALLVRTKTELHVASAQLGLLFGVLGIERGL